MEHNDLCLSRAAVWRRLPVAGETALIIRNPLPQLGPFIAQSRQFLLDHGFIELVEQRYGLL
jgi:hypothetical protein